MPKAQKLRPLPLTSQDRIVILTAGAGLFLSTLDSGIINVALPTLMHVFHAQLATISWTVIFYTLTLVGTITIFGRLSDHFGRLTVYRWGLLLFGTASILSGFSTSSGMLIAFRGIQGIGAAMLQATAVAIITAVMPRERQGPALGSLALLMGLGPLLGPTIGGLLISVVGWPWIFWMNIPITLGALWGCQLLVKTPESTGRYLTLDIPGNLLLSGTALGFMGGLTMGASHGLGSAFTWIPLIISLGLLMGFLKWEEQAHSPIVDLKLFRRGTLAAPMMAIFWFGGASSLGFIIPPYYLEQIHHLPPWQAGFANLFAPLGIVVLSRMSGRLMQRIGTSGLMVAGLACMTAAYAVLSFMRSTWSFTALAGLLLVYGLGGGLFLSSNIAAIMGAVPLDVQGTIGAVQRMVQNLGIALDTTVVASLVGSPIHRGVSGLMTGFRASWAFAALTLLGSLFALLLLMSSKRRSLS